VDKAEDSQLKGRGFKQPYRILDGLKAKQAVTVQYKTRINFAKSSTPKTIFLNLFLFIKYPTYTKIVFNGQGLRIELQSFPYQGA